MTTEFFGMSLFGNIDDFDMCPGNFSAMAGVATRPSRKKRQRKKNLRKANSLAWQHVGNIPVQKQTDPWMSEMSQAMWK